MKEVNVEKEIFILYFMDNDFYRWRVKRNEEVAYYCTMDWTVSEWWWKDKKWRREKKWEEMKEWIGNGIGDEGAKAIGESLKINTSLTELYLSGDEKKWKKWIENEIGDEGAKVISESLKINTSLTSLSLRCDEKIRNENGRIE